jgi:hypothetical protein
MEEHTTTLPKGTIGTEAWGQSPKSKSDKPYIRGGEKESALATPTSFEGRQRRGGKDHGVETGEIQFFGEVGKGTIRSRSFERTTAESRPVQECLLRVAFAPRKGGPGLAPFPWPAPLGRRCAAEN